MARRRMSDMRRAAVETAMRERDRQREAEVKASEEAGTQDAKTYREVSSDLIHGHTHIICIYRYVYVQDINETPRMKD